MKRINIGALIIALLIPLLVGALSAAISAKGMNDYGTMSKPPLSPPAWAFPVAWTILYIMMGLASYCVFVSESGFGNKTLALLLYCVQLGMNFMWSIIFFNANEYLLAFAWLIVMWCIVIFCAVRFWNISRMATYLFVPYIAWLTFAAYLNLGTYIISIKS